MYFGEFFSVNTANVILCDIIIVVGLAIFRG